MRVVLDTNVIVSGLLTPGGLCRQVLDAALAGAAQPCVDARILWEYEAVLPRPLFGIAPEDVAATLRVMRLLAERMSAAPLRVNLPHANDLPFLEVAREADAILVTGNLRHFPEGQRAGVTVLSPREFLDLLAQPS